MARYCVWVSSRPVVVPVRAGIPANRYLAGRYAGVTPDLTVEATYLPPGGRVRALTPYVPLWLAEVARARARLDDDRAVSGPAPLSGFQFWRRRCAAAAALRAWGSGVIATGSAERARWLPALPAPVQPERQGDELQALGPGDPALAEAVLTL
jgi:hypothetical protein